MMKTELITHVFLILATTMSGCKSNNNEKLILDNNLLMYENYTQKEISLPDFSFMQALNYCFLDSLGIDASVLKDLKKEHMLSGEIFHVLYAQNIINKWDIHKDREYSFKITYNEYIEKKKQEMALFYMGKYDVDKNFNSHLILSLSMYGYDDKFMTIDDTSFYSSIDCELFMINSIDNKIKSILCVAYYLYDSLGGGLLHKYTQKINDDVFLQRVEVKATDVTFAEAAMEEYEAMLAEQKHSYVKFFFDKDGYVKMP